MRRAGIYLRLCFVATEIILYKKNILSSVFAHTETWSLSSGSQTRQTSCTAWPGVLWRYWQGGSAKSEHPQCAAVLYFFDVSAVWAVTLHCNLCWFYQDISVYVLTQYLQRPQSIQGKRWTFLRRESRCLRGRCGEVFGICCIVFPIKWYIICL